MPTSPAPALDVRATARRSFSRLQSSRFARHVSVLTFASVGQAAVHLAAVLIVARVLGPSAYGVATLVMSWPLLVLGILDVGSSEAGVKYLKQFAASGDHERARAMCKLGYALDAGVATVGVLLVVATAAWAERTIVHAPGIVLLMVAFALCLVPRALANTSRAVLMVSGRFSLLARIEFFTAVVGAVAAVALVLSGAGIAGVVAGVALQGVFSGAAFMVAAAPVARGAYGGSWLGGRLSSLKGHRRGLARFLVFNDLNVLVGLVVKQADVIILGALRGPVDVGLFKIAKSLTAAVGYVMRPLQSVSYPRIAELVAAGRSRELSRYVRQLALKVGIPLGALTAAGALLVPLVFPLVVGPQYAPAAFAAQILLVGSAISIVFFWQRPLFLSHGRVRAWFLLSALIAAVTLGGWLAVIPRYGYEGMALWLLAMYAFGHLSMLFMALRWKAPDKLEGAA